ncbi:MAG: RNA polymerase sigma factor region1.1 domain-containing protein, partial [Patescibacteria group bacterium]
MAKKKQKRAKKKARKAVRPAKKRAVKKPVKKAKVKAKPKKAAPVKPKPKMSPRKRAALEAKAERLITKGKGRGYVTYNEILKEFPTIEEDVIFLEELYERFQTSGIDVLESGGMLEEVPDEVVMRGGYRGEGSAHDSIQMYLREIGQYPL